MRQQRSGLPWLRLRCSWGPQEFRDRILRDVPRWKDAIAKAHIKAE
jgi:hypothetical protein